jgi:uncharacterized iron-regulated protein
MLPLEARGAVFGRKLFMTLAAASMGMGGAAAGSDGLEAFLLRAESADIIVVGEIHDNPSHHEIQARVVRHLQPAGIVFEMIPQARSEIVNRLREEGAGRSEIAEALEWEASGWPDFDLYAPILEAAPDARIYGAGQPGEVIRRASRERAAAAFGAEAARFGLDAALDEAEEAFLRESMAAAHCNALPDAALDGMIEVQRLWDAALARAALRALAETGDGAQVVMIAGNGHADRDRGAPSVIARAEPAAEVLVLGLTEGAANTDRRFDMTIASEAPPAREDPCAAFETSTEE